MQVGAGLQMKAIRLHYLRRIFRAIAPIIRWIAVSTALFLSTTTVAVALAVDDNASAAPIACERTSGESDPAPCSSPLIMAANAAFGLAAMQNGNVMQRMTALRSGAHGVDLAGFSVQVADQRIGGDLLNAVSRPTFGKILESALSGADDAGRIGLFANGNAQVGSGGGIDDGFDLATGIDYRMRDDLAVGASMGYSSTGVASGSGALDIESWRGTLFGTYYAKDRFHVDGLLAYGSSGYDSSRRIQDGEAQTVATGTTKGRQLSAELRSAFDFSSGPWLFGPNLGASFLNVDVARLGEVGAADYEMMVGRQNARSLRINAGGRLALTVRVPWGVVTPHVNADYVHDRNGRADTIGVRLRNDSFATDAVTLRTARPGAGYFVWSVGASAQLARVLSGFISYQSCAAAGNFTSNELTGGMRFEATL